MDVTARKQHARLQGWISNFSDGLLVFPLGYEPPMCDITDCYRPIILEQGLKRCARHLYSVEKIA